MKVFKKDQRILNRYFEGKTIKQTLQTPLKNVRAYLAEDDSALLISTKSQRVEVSMLVALMTLQRGMKSSMYTEGTDLVCLLTF